MARTTAERVDWVVFFDGAKALLFQNEGFNDAPNFKLIDKEEIDNPPDRELKTDAPGRMGDNGRGQRSAMEETDFHDQQERRFVKNLAESISQHALKDKFDRLYVFGAPHAMGDFRDNLHEEAVKRIVKQVTGDYTNHPTDKLEAAFKKEAAPEREESYEI